MAFSWPRVVSHRPSVSYEVQHLLSLQLSLKLIHAHVLSALWSLNSLYLDGEKWACTGLPELLSHCLVISSRFLINSFYFPNQENFNGSLQGFLDNKLLCYLISMIWVTRIYTIYFLGLPYSFLQLFSVPCPILYSFLVCKIPSVSNAYSFTLIPQASAQIQPLPTLQTPPLAMVSFFLSSCDRHLSLINNPHIAICIQVTVSTL